MGAAKVFGVWSLGIVTSSFLANVNTSPELAQFGLGSIAIIPAGSVQRTGAAPVEERVEEPV